MGVSGGGGEPLCALTVDVDAVELMRLTSMGVGTLSTGSFWLGPVYTTGAAGAAGAALEPAAGGGKYCWWYSGYGLLAPTSSLPFLCGAFWNKPSLSGASGPGESGSGFGAVPLRSASLEGWMEPSGFRAP